MRVITSKSLNFLINFGEEKPGIYELPPGEYEVEEIPSPFTDTNQTFIFLKGTLIGAVADLWRGIESINGSLELKT